MGSTPAKRDLLWRSPALRLSIAVGSCALLVAWRLRKFAYLPILLPTHSFNSAVEYLRLHLLQLP
jgi:hypothetical protein